MAEHALAESITMNRDLDEPEDIIKLYARSFEELKSRYPKIVAFAAAHGEWRAAIASRMMKFNADIKTLRLLY